MSHEYQRPMHLRIDGLCREDGGTAKSVDGDPGLAAAIDMAEEGEERPGQRLSAKEDVSNVTEAT